MASSDPQKSPKKSVLLLLSPVFSMEFFMDIQRTCLIAGSMFILGNQACLPRKLGWFFSRKTRMDLKNIYQLLKSHPYWGGLRVAHTSQDAIVAQEAVSLLGDP